MNKIITEISATDNVSSVVAKISRDVSAFAQDTGEAVRRIAQATEGLDMFAQKGVNIYEPLAKELKMSEAVLRKAAKTGELAFADVGARFSPARRERAFSRNRRIRNFRNVHFEPLNRRECLRQTKFLGGGGK